MTRKQELYAQLLQDGVLIIRSQQSEFYFYRWWRRLPWYWHAKGKDSYLVAQFMHMLPMLVKYPEFDDGDFWFLNHHARTFFQKDASPFLKDVFFARLRELFDLVPSNQKHHLEWDGPRR